MRVEIVQLIICIVGLVLYFICEAKTKWPVMSKVGFAMFCIGLLAWLLTGAKF